MDSRGTDRSAKTHSGGCLCGAVRFVVRGPATRVNHCHCTQCRRVSGAIAQTWVTFAAADLALERGAPAGYRASDFATRKFCGTCGSTLFWMRDGAAIFDVAIGALDAPEEFRADRHDFAGTRLAGFALDPHLPEFDD
jgi:hypothetical protein